MSSRKHIKRGDEKTEINISPMIDCVFILLIFFIVTTVFVEEEGMDVDKPTPQTEPDDQDRDPVIFRISSTSQVSHDGQVIALSRVETVVRTALSTDSTLPIILQVERGALSGVMIQVMDRAKVGGADKISISAIN